MQNSNFHTTKTVNKIKLVIDKKGFKELIPSAEELKKMDCSLVMWNKWVARKRDPELYQLAHIALFLDCKISELMPFALYDYE